MALRPPPPFQIELPFLVKGYDVDAAGIVSNIVYVRWLEDLRLQLLAGMLPWLEYFKAGFGPVLARTEIDYKRPLRLADTPRGQMWVSELGRARWGVQAEFLLGDRVVALARQVGYWVNMVSMRPAPIPEDLRQRFAAARSVD